MVPRWFQLGSNWFRLSKLSHVKHQSLVPAWFHLVSNVEADTPSVPLHGHQQPSLGATTKHLKVQKYTHSAGPLSGPPFPANSADDGALHSVCALPSAPNFHTTRQEVQRKIFVRSSRVERTSTSWSAVPPGPTTAISGHNQAWLPRHSESRKPIRVTHFLAPNFSSLPAKKFGFRGTSFGSTIPGTSY